MSQEYVCEIRAEAVRGCGRRHSGPDGVGIYLVGGLGGWAACDRLPFPLIDQEGNPQPYFRGVKEINPAELFHDNASPIKAACFRGCSTCPMGGLRKEYGILQFVGREHYSLEEFHDEVNRMGASRRVNSIPNNFIPGAHWLYLAHLDGATRYDPDKGEVIPAPAIIRAYMPRVELVIDDPNNIPEKAKRLKDKYGNLATIVKVVPV